MTWRKVIFTPSCVISYTTKGRYTLWNQFRSSNRPYNYFVHIWSTGTGCVECHVVEWSAWRIAFVVCIIRVPWVLLNACDNSTTAESLSCVDHIVNVHLIRGDFVAFFSRVGAHFARVSFELFYTFRASRTHAAMSVCVCACLRVCSYDQVCTWFSYACRRIIQIPHSCFVSHGSLVIVDIFRSVQMVHQVYSGSYTRGESGYSLPKVAVPPPQQNEVL